MWAANVTATARVLDAAAATGVARIVYTSTANVLGNTMGQLAGRDLSPAAAAGLPVLVRRDEVPRSPPGRGARGERRAGPDRHARHDLRSGRPLAGGRPDPAGAGRQAPVLSVPDLGGNLAHVDDIATGILLVHDRGSLGGEYLLGGEVATMRQVIQRAAALGGHPPPRFEVPSWLVRGVGAAGSVSALLRGPGPGRAGAASLGVTYWFSDAKARPSWATPRVRSTRGWPPCSPTGPVGAPEPVIGHPAAILGDERDDAGAVRAALRHEASRDGASRPPEHAELARRAAGRPAGMASDILADEWTDRGVVAQLGEHLHGMQGVGGSSPPSSTTHLGQVTVVPRWEPPSS